MANFSNTLPFNLQGSGSNSIFNQTIPLINNTSTPQYNIPKPNTATGIAYGGSPTVPSNQYGSSTLHSALPSTPLKSQSTSPDGTTVSTYHAPAAAPAGNSQTPLVQNSTTQTPQPPKFDTPVGQAINQGQNGSQIAPKNPILAAAYDQATYAPNLRQNLSNSELALTRTGIALPFISGQQGALEQAYGNEIAGQGQKAQALGNLAGYGQPQQYSLTSQPYNPLTDTYGGGGAGGAINRSVQASNIGSAGDFASKIQQTQAAANAADANFSILNSYAKGFAGDTPIINGLKQLYGTTVQGSQAIAGFQAQLQNVRSAYQAITGGDPTAAISDTITPNQLQEVQQTLKSTAQNNVTGFQNQLGSLQGGGTSTNTSGSSSFGGAAWK